MPNMYYFYRVLLLIVLIIGYRYKTVERAIHLFYAPGTPNMKIYIVFFFAYLKNFSAIFVC